MISFIKKLKNSEIGPYLTNTYDLWHKHHSQCNKFREFKIRSKEEIPGPALSEWWNAKGDDSVLLEDYLDKIPWLPELFIEATEAVGSKNDARAWLFEENIILGIKMTIDSLKRRKDRQKYCS